VRGLLDAALGDHAAAGARFSRARARAVEHGHQPWIEQLDRDLAALPGQAAPRLAAPIASPTPPRAVTLELAGPIWTVRWGDDVVVRVKDSRGMQLLARLIARPGDDVHVLALASDGDGPVPESDAGEVIDEAARRAYRARLDELAVAIPAARQAGDPRRCAALVGEQQALEAELTAATGLGGRRRRQGSATERARTSIQRRLRDAIARISELDAALGGYLDRVVRTGTYCSFRPE
jgi:hypothetical protein